MEPQVANGPGDAARLVVGGHDGEMLFGGGKQGPELGR
jgi:hypothetical protein